MRTPTASRRGRRTAGRSRSASTSTGTGTGAGGGRRLYEALLERLAERGYRRAMAGMSLPNEASVAFHRALGFEPVGVYRRSAGSMVPGGTWPGCSGRSGTPPIRRTSHSERRTPMRATVVTGGGQGIGRAVAERLLRTGPATSRARSFRSTVAARCSGRTRRAGSARPWRDHCAHIVQAWRGSAAAPTRSCWSTCSSPAVRRPRIGRASVPPSVGSRRRRSSCRTRRSR